ncbi:multicopper oxidase [Truncatella angustata]|uniref:laccase n=1 Tax=Truncatella angustata TaxID=152316 RepID=A0A9P8UIA7_9PEZI|nr:multicopper oxidase [Truncatella angustata]KAH6652707.1 multicopper oxidase [Truncatella angustata]
MRSSTILSSVGALISVAVAAPYTGSHGLSQRQTCEFDSANSPDCWGDFSLSTNWYEEAPDTGVVREYWFEVAEHTAAPDGVERLVMSINGSIPGPTIYADWGDTIVLHVNNALTTNGTSIHFHGIRQNHTAQEDGVASITQCPAAPGDSLTYTWRATQYGTTWYHSHFSLQAWNGVFGGIVINGPASSAYDVDKGIIFLNDWYHSTSDELFVTAATSGPPPSQNGLINGTNVYNSGGSRFQTSVTAGQSYRLRLVNGAMDTMFRFSIDNHTLTVISSDLVPIEPYETDSVNVGIGQRYDVIVTANQDAGNYWLRAVPQQTCSATNENTLDIKGIFNYDSVDVADPTTITSISADNCDDEPVVPFVALNVDDAGLEDVFDIGIDTTTGLFRWTINSNPFLSDWGSPTLQQVADGVSTFDVEQQVVHLNETDQWVYFVIQSTFGIHHPIHLHGHDFFVLAQEQGATWADGNALNTVNPPRRDVAMLPASGYLVIAYQADNPGVWLMHCHIGWHTSEGFALQLVERQSEIAATVDEDSMNQTCDNWNAFQDNNDIVQEDSGV